MIQIHITRKFGDMQISVAGHAEFNPGGPDIVCAAVSTIIQTAALGLMAVADEFPDNVKVTIEDE